MEPAKQTERGEFNWEKGKIHALRECTYLSDDVAWVCLCFKMSYFIWKSKQKKTIWVGGFKCVSLKSITILTQGEKVFFYSSASSSPFLLTESRVVCSLESESLGVAAWVNFFWLNIRTSPVRVCSEEFLRVFFP